MVAASDSCGITLKRAVIVVGILLAILVLGFVLLPKKAISPEINVPSNLQFSFPDNMLRSIFKASTRLEVDAHGELAAEKTTVGEHKVRVDEGTTFELNVSLDILDDGSIDLGKSTGKLKFSKPIFVGELPMPTDVELANSKVQIDMLLYCRKIIGAVVENLWQDSTPGGIFLKNSAEPTRLNSGVSPGDANTDSKKLAGIDLPDLLRHLSVASLILHLRENGVIHRDSNTLKIGKDSQFQLKNVEFVERKNWSGQLISQLHLMKDTILKEQNLIMVPHDEAQLDGTFSASCKNGCIKIGKSDGSTNPLLIGPFDIQQSRDKQSLNLSNVELGLEKLDCLYDLQNNSGQIEAVGNLQVNSGLSYEAGSLSLKSSAKERVNLPFQITHKGNSQDLTISSASTWTLPSATLTDSTASGARLVFNTSGMKLQPFKLSASNKPTLNLNGIELLPKSVTYSKGSSSTTVELSNSKLVTTSPIELVNDTSGQHLAPLKVAFSGANVVVHSGRKDSIKLEKVAGALDASLRGPDAQVNISLDALAAPKQLGLGSVELKVHKAQVSFRHGLQTLALEDCSVLMSKKEMEQKIVSLVPSEISHSVDATLQREIPLRWRNPTLKQISLQNLSLQNIDIINDGAKLKLSSDLSLKGVVDRCHAALGLGSNEEKGRLHLPHQRADISYESKPWSAIAKNAKCDVQSKFVYLPGKTLKSSKLNIVIDATVPIPGDVQIDWTQVTSDGISRVENFLGEKLLDLARRKFKDGIPVHIEKSIPVISSAKGEKSLLGENADRRLNDLTISRLSIKPVGDNLELELSGTLRM